jgi:trimethylamine--corrinoid protein Co-methyltransferase
MNLSGLSGGQYKPLSLNQIEILHGAALSILEKTGMIFEPGLEDVAELLESNGAILDMENRIFRFPPGMVTEVISKAPEKFVLYGRKKENDLCLSKDKVHLGTGGAAIKILDLDTGAIRPTTLADLEMVSRLVDQLENIHFLVRPCIPTDIDEADYDINMYYACLSATTKHVMSGVNNEKGLADVINMASLIAGGEEKLKARPFISVITSFAISPLKLCTQSTRIMRAAVKERIPVALSCAPMAGSTSPLTMAGTLAQMHAEQLAGITICQLTNPGAPILYGGIPGRANLKTMGYQGGAVECGIMNAAVHQLSDYIKIPNYNSSGLTDSKIPDGQAGYEKAFTTLLAAMGGSNYVHHAAGMLESMLTIAHEQFVIDDEIIGNACKVLQGINCDEEHLALDVIEEVGPGGNYIMSPHTMEHLYSEYYMGNGVTDQKSRANWEKDGSPDIRERARKIARSILDELSENKIPEDIDQEIRKKFNILLNH